jgi:hypothetical protein
MLPTGRKVTIRVHVGTQGEATRLHVPGEKQQTAGAAPGRGESEGPGGPAQAPERPGATRPAVPATQAWWTSQAMPW